ITTSGGPYPIQTATTFAGNKSIMKITPGVAATGLKLLPGLRYDLLLTSGLTDRAGNPLVPVAASFFTVSQSTTGGRDITPPVLVFSNPADGSTNVDPNTKILLTFSEELTTTAKNRSNFTITSDVTSTTPAQDAEVISSPPNSLRIDPGKLLGNTKHSVVLSNAITDKAGNALQPTAFAFTTAQVVGTDQDRTPPVVLSTNPPNNSAAVAIDGVISVTFSKAVNFNPVSPGSLTSTSALTSALNPQNYELFSTFDNPGILTVTQLPFPANTVQLTPAAILRGGTVYNLLASSRIQDAARNNLVSTLISFTTVNQPGTGQGDSTSPQVTAVNPPSGSQVSNPNTSIVFTFSEPMSEASSNQTSSVTNVDNYFVATGCDAGTLASTPNIITPTAIVPLTVPANSYRVQLRSNADDPLDPVNRIYIVELSNRITDRAGNPLTPFRLQFTQGAPPSAPAISFTSVDTSPVPTDTGTNSTFITVQFDRDVADTNGGTLTNNFIVTGIAKDNTEANNHPSDFAIDIDATNTAESSPGVFKLVLKRRPPGTDNDANFRLKKGGSFSLTVVGFSGADSCSQSMSSFKKDFTATGQ
ncbi:MAG: Ig-like domain-containing protein, partial [Candidatus Wallbacteria bacterium]|nr:Ig-like domain-containing protein [Candidatus Wallbacteria bacterium]